MTPTERLRDSPRDDHAGALLVVGILGAQVTPRERELLAEVRPGGVILFRRNVESAGQLHDLVGDLRETLPDLLLYSDSEGGRVDRLDGIAGPAPAGSDLAAVAPKLARTSGRWVGESLRLFGLDVDFAPVVDLDRGQEDNALATRYLGRTPEAVAVRAEAFLEGLHGAGVGGCLKHYPGLGSTFGDTHRTAGHSDLSLAELAHDEAPFALLAGVAGAVMVSHAVFPALDPECRPSTLSPPVYQRLTDNLGPDVLRFSDDLEMGALDSIGDLPERAVACLTAGGDVLSFCHSLERMPEVVEALSAPRLEARRREALGRTVRYGRHLDELGAAARALGLAPDLALVRKRLAKLQERVRAVEYDGGTVVDPTESVDPTVT